MKIAAFDIDAQKGFTPLCPDELPVSGGDKIVPELNFMASLASLRIGRGCASAKCCMGSGFQRRNAG